MRGRPDVEPDRGGGVQVVRGEGMPVSKQPGVKGDLRISFDIVFPKQLSDQQKAQLRQILPATAA